ncbi:MAG: sugar phosphate isomerase/epimerase family protein, partial [Pseudonocardiaceae bacterium]
EVIVVKLGFFTACLPCQDLRSIAAWAAHTGFSALEVAAWPTGQSRDHIASHLDVQDFGPDQAAAVLALSAEHELTLSAVSYYDNNLHPDQDQRAHIHQHLRACISAAALLEVPCVGTFVGRDPSRTVAENQALAQRELPPLVEFAGERGVKLVVENCPMGGWHPDGYPGNLAYSPELWEWMFSLGLYLNYDPSHLVWLGIDPVRVLRQYVDRVLHVQAKDTEVNPDNRNRYGVFGQVVDRTNPWDSGWWRYRVPGLGDVDWRGVTDALYEGGYDGAVAIEHEDPVWSGTEKRVSHGLEVARRTLQPLIVA